MTGCLFRANYVFALFARMGLLTYVRRFTLIAFTYWNDRGGKALPKTGKPLLTAPSTSTNDQSILVRLGLLVNYSSTTYHCTHAGQDLTRFEIRTTATEDDKPEAHHCTAWGPAALDLHRHLNPGDRLLVRGELRYRSRTLRQGGTLRVPVIYVRGYAYLGR